MTPKEFLDENYFSLTLDCKREIEEIYQAIEEYSDYVLKSKLEGIKDEVKKIEENLILIIEGFEDAKENYGYDLANETYYIEEIIQSTKAIKYKTKTIKR